MIVFRETNLIEPAHERGVAFGINAHDIDIFEPGAPIESKVREVLTEKSEAFTKEENSDQRQDDNGDKRVAPEKTFDDPFRG